MYVCITIITNYLHINVNYHTKPLVRKSLVFVYQPIKCYIIFPLLFDIILSSFHFIFNLLFFYNFSLFLYMFLSMCSMLNFSICFSTCVICVIYVFFCLSLFILFVFIYSAFMRILYILFNFSSLMTKNFLYFLVIFKTIISCLFVSHLQGLCFFVELW
jgi:hypothetical protein